jgi:hypothetical protein
MAVGQRFGYATESAKRVPARRLSAVTADPAVARTDLEDLHALG